MYVCNAVPIVMLKVYKPPVVPIQHNTTSQPGTTAYLLFLEFTFRPAPTLILPGPPPLRSPLRIAGR